MSVQACFGRMMEVVVEHRRMREEVVVSSSSHGEECFLGWGGWYMDGTRVVVEVVCTGRQLVYGMTEEQGCMMLD